MSIRLLNPLLFAIAQTGGGQRVGEGGERRRATKAAAAACGGGVRVFSVTSDGT